MAEKSEILDVLLDNGVITDADYERVLILANERGVEPALLLLEENDLGLDTTAIIATVAQELEVDFVRLIDVDIDPDSLSLLTDDQAQSLGALPIDYEDGALRVAVPLANIRNLTLKRDLQRATGEPVITLVAATRSDIAQTITRVYRVDKALTALTQSVEEEQAAIVAVNDTPEIADEIGEENQVVQFVDLILTQAVKDKASDIHFDPSEKQLDIRFRIDGVLYTKTYAPKAIQNEIVSRVKVMANLDPANRLRPQDGRLSQTIAGRKIDFRVATLPAIWGEKIVMRILDNSSASLPLSVLGFAEENLDKFRSIIHKPHGLLLVTGPTGSGKSTTLYSALNEIVSPEINIITAEDPVEYRIAGINQIEIKAKQELTFAAVLRTILRSDPDVILLGEIRDSETAHIATEAAMTGHLVLSTLHTNDAASAVTRLGEMGIPTFITSSSVVGVVSQRLIRKLCEKCKEPYVPTQNELDAAHFPYEDEENLPTLYRRHEGGCKECNNTGFKGRVAIHEVLTMTPAIEDAINGGAKTNEISRMARDDGMTTLAEDGFAKVATGLTSIEEVMRVVVS